jgi:transcription antitermination factor NusG
MGIADFYPGDVVFVPEGPFRGVCGVVEAVDIARAELRLIVSSARQALRHQVTVSVDEVEPA